MIQPDHIDLPSGRFAYLAEGDEGAPLVVCLHGFPDHPPSFAPLLRALAGDGYRAVAPYLRGYAPSTLDGPFHLDRIAADLIELCDALSPAAPCAVVGHDWGAAATYVALAGAPERFFAAVTMAVPHPMRFLRALAQPRQLRRSWYMLLFQLPAIPERRVARNDFAFIDRLWRAWSPGYEPHGPAMAVLKRCLAESMPAPIEYYRAMFQPPHEALPRAARPLPRITVPTLHLQGTDDGCIGVDACDGQDRYFDGPFRSEVIAHAGHFLQLEAPGHVAEKVLAWLRHHRD